VGYPTFALSCAIAEAALDAGADALELGVPFSDPIADGPTLQKATHLALSRGIHVNDVFRLIRHLRAKGYQQPLFVMSYLNPLEQIGWEKFGTILKSAGGNGAIVPDLPLEQSAVRTISFRKKGLALIPFLSPTSEKSRWRRADSLRAPFLYYVAVTGVTGARKKLVSGLGARLQAIRRVVRTPLVVGFGISNAHQARQVGQFAAGVIMASALVDLIARTSPNRVKKVVNRYCRTVVNALQKKKR